ncbi:MULTISPECIES: ArsR/SmtB family transcription factor [Streptomyces]|uniref:Helix-turn-helix domain-containing protein n=2 Tax=Streptomyces TaxID=1883 RepID=A0ABU4K3K1_9ACTN|nr:helix-turn-helix domain-containing protein [Streptomyces roseolus]MDX2292331.1 helix-turn-helix domain-containing protein [Streptomyces roseolus]
MTEQMTEQRISDIRIAVSPLWEVLEGVVLVTRYGSEAPWPYRAWARRAHGVLTPRLRAVARLVRPQGRMPAFLTPAVASRSVTVTDQLDEVRRTPPDVVREELARGYRGAQALPEIAALVKTPETELPALADELDAFWTAAVEHHWPRIARSLEEEVLFRSRTLAMSGGSTLLRELELPAGRIAGARRLTVVPALLSDGTHLWSRHADGRTVVSFKARGVGVLGAEARGRDAYEPGHGDRMAILLGRGRASVIRELCVPTTTSALAENVGLAASTVSQHLSALVSAGVVQRHRVGTRVLYQLNDWGVTLTECLEDRTTVRS